MSYPQSKFLREKREKESVLRAKTLKFHLKNQMKTNSKPKICDIVNF